MPGALAGSKVFSRRGPGPRAAVGFEIGRDQARISRDQARGRDSGSEPRPGSGRRRRAARAAPAARRPRRPGKFLT